MPSLRNIGLPAKIFLLSILGILLSLGLCGYGGDTRHPSTLQVTATSLGSLLFLVSIPLFFLAILMAIISAIRGYD